MIKAVVVVKGKKPGKLNLGTYIYLVCCMVKGHQPGKLDLVFLFAW